MNSDSSDKPRVIGRCMICDPYSKHNDYRHDKRCPGYGPVRLTLEELKDAFPDSSEDAIRHAVENPWHYAEDGETVLPGL